MSVLGLSANMKEAKLIERDRFHSLDSVKLAGIVSDDHAGAVL